MIVFPIGGRYCSRIIVLGGNAFVFERMSAKIDTAAVAGQRARRESMEGPAVDSGATARLALGGLPHALLALLILPVDLLQRHPSARALQHAVSQNSERATHLASEPGRSSTERILGSIPMRVVVEWERKRRRRVQGVQTCFRTPMPGMASMDDVGWRGADEAFAAFSSTTCVAV
jgi:hypothetical protein